MSEAGFTQTHSSCSPNGVHREWWQKHRSAAKAALGSLFQASLGSSGFRLRDVSLRSTISGDNAAVSPPLPPPYPQQDSGNKVITLRVSGFKRDANGRECPASASSTISILSSSQRATASDHDPCCLRQQRGGRNTGTKLLRNGANHQVADKQQNVFCVCILHRVLEIYYTRGTLEGALP